MANYVLLCIVLLVIPTGLCSCVPEGEISSVRHRYQISQELLPQRTVLSISKPKTLLWGCIFHLQSKHLDTFHNNVATTPKPPLASPWLWSKGHWLCCRIVKLETVPQWISSIRNRRHSWSSILPLRDISPERLSVLVQRARGHSTVFLGSSLSVSVSECLLLKILKQAGFVKWDVLQSHSTLCQNPDDKILEPRLPRNDRKKRLGSLLRESMFSLLTEAEASRIWQLLTRYST